MMPPGRGTLWNTCYIFVNNINNRSDRPNNLYNGEEGNNNSCTYKTTIKTYITA